MRTSVYWQPIITGKLKKENSNRAAEHSEIFYVYLYQGVNLRETRGPDSEALWAGHWAALTELNKTTSCHIDNTA